MPKLSTEEAQRLDRLTGSGEGWGGGLPLPHLFQEMLHELLDAGQATTARMVEITETVLDGKNAAVKATRPDGSGTFEAVAWDVLAQMQSRQIIRADGEFWIPGPGLKTGEYIEVIRARDDKRHGLKFPADGTTVWEKAEREALSRESYAEHEISSLASQLQPDGRGLRPVDHAHVAGLRKSQETLGQLYPVLVDKNGRVLDGKHRKAADPGWREVTIEKVLGRAVDDDTALAVAAVANSGRPWPKALQARVEQLLGAPRPKRDAVRDRIRAELLEDHERPDKTLAKIVGCSDMTVRAERLDLEGKSQIGIFRQGRGRPRTDGTPPRRQDTTPEQRERIVQLHSEGLSDTKICDQTGLGITRVRNVTHSLRQKDIDQPAPPEATTELASEPAHEHVWVCQVCGMPRPEI